jgi:hypothetical protein
MMMIILGEQLLTRSINLLYVSFRIISNLDKNDQDLTLFTTLKALMIIILDRDSLVNNADLSQTCRDASVRL